MKLYELERDKNIELYATDINNKPITIIFGHIDGAYSYCWVKDEPEKLVHISASTQIEKDGNGYKVL